MCSAPLGDQLLCAGAWVLSAFAQKSMARGASFVRRRVGFKRFEALEMLLLCAGAWVLSVFPQQKIGWQSFLCTGAWVLSIFMLGDSIFVRRHVGFKEFYSPRFNFCSQVHGF